MWAFLHINTKFRNEKYENKIDLSVQVSGKEIGIMSAQSNMVNMQVPVEMLETLQAFMASMNMNKTTPQASSSSGDVYYEHEPDRCEVAAVVSHRVRKEDNHLYDFEVVWKSNKRKQWVADEDCNCEQLISEYLASKGIRTAYLFCRVSTKEQATSTHLSLEAQEAELREAAKNGGYERIRVYSISCSAYKKIPEQLAAVAEAAHAGDAIMVWRVDRLSRNIEDYMGMIKELHNKGVNLYSHNEQITYAENKMEFLQALLDAQKEAHILGQRVKLAVRRKRERGDVVGSVAYGYMHHRVYSADRQTTVRVVRADNDAEQNVLRRIHKEFKQSKSSKQIAYGLNRSGIKKRGRKWTPSMVNKIVKHK